jgi:transposase
MTHSYSLDLRVRVAAFVEAGHSRRAAARHFKVSDSFAIKLMQRQRQCGSPAPARQGRPRGTGKLACYEAFLIRTVEARPDITMPELAARRLDEQGVSAAPATLSRLLCRRGFPYKKAQMAAECARAVKGHPDLRDTATARFTSGTRSGRARRANRTSLRALASAVR